MPRKLEELLATKSIPINIRSPTFKVSPLFMAICGGATNTAKILLEHGASISEIDSKGDALWPLPIFKEQQEVFDLIFVHGESKKHTQWNPQLNLTTNLDGYIDDISILDRDGCTNNELEESYLNCEVKYDAALTKYGSVRHRARLKCSRYLSVTAPQTYLTLKLYRSTTKPDSQSRTSILSIGNSWSLCLL